MRGRSSPRAARPRQARRVRRPVRLRHDGGTSAKALPVYELQAKEFTGYWSGQESLDDALAKTQAGMEELLKK